MRWPSATRPGLGSQTRCSPTDVRARFPFEDGWIAEHIDSFSFYAWSRQGLGPLGTVLGWTPLLRNMVRGKARTDLQAFMAR
jgi:hypothetical protein